MAAAAGAELVVEVIEAKNVKIGDIRTSDPFCELHISSIQPTHETVVKTKIIANTLNPVWRETFRFHCPVPNEDILIIKVYDHDSGSLNDLLGTVEFPVCATFGRGHIDEWRIIRKPENRTVQGEGQLHIAVSWTGAESKLPDDVVADKHEKAKEKQKEKERKKDKKEKDGKKDKKDKKDKDKDKDGKKEKKDKDKKKDKKKDK